MAEVQSDRVSFFVRYNQQVITKIAVCEYPYDCEVSGDGKRVYVSNWGSRSVAVIDTADNRVINNIPVGDHPNDLELTRDGKTLYVANANINTVSEVWSERRKHVGRSSD